MIKRADDLRSCARNKRVITAEVKEVLHAMEVEMVNANKDGRSKIDFNVPKSYSTIGNDVDSIMVIVTQVLRELIDADYMVKIYDREHTYLFDIRWSTELTSNDRHKMITLLKKHIGDEKDS
jgi:hypothetical protein